MIAVHEAVLAAWITGGFLVIGILLTAGLRGLRKDHEGVGQSLVHLHEKIDDGFLRNGQDHEKIIAASTAEDERRTADAKAAHDAIHDRIDKLEDGIVAAPDAPDD